MHNERSCRYLLTDKDKSFVVTFNIVPIIIYAITHLSLGINEMS